MTTRPDDTPERIGRALGRLAGRGRVAIRQAGDPQTQARMVAFARAAGAVARKRLGDQGPDVAERAAQGAVDRGLWFLRLRYGFLATLLEPFAAQTRSEAGRHARRLATPIAETESIPTDDAPPAGSPPPGDAPPPSGEKPG